MRNHATIVVVTAKACGHRDAATPDVLGAQTAERREVRRGRGVRWGSLGSGRDARCLCLCRCACIVICDPVIAIVCAVHKI